MYIYPFTNADEQSKTSVWNKGREIPGFNSNVWRWDICGKAMKYSEHGNINSENGWEIDHKYPSSLGGSDELDNLQPLQWGNNRLKGDNYPWSCP